ncbi:uncharacterized protein LOC129600765 [Paramacrobiotus metropolitanus]|uniref:uncharacterized protein LOC129600765 n=1 Tax=Paramacrobiotus metropolitanus TaxID=2943436 RepID=UPI002446206D|nr:uncharacterized protein LOC129600765 [Paramacrobiotus metropolitanus]
MLLWLFPLPLFLPPAAWAIVKSCYECDSSTLHRDCHINRTDRVTQCAPDTHYCRLDFLSRGNLDSTKHQINIPIIEDIAPVERVDKSYVYITEETMHSITLSGDSINNPSLFEEIEKRSPSLPAELNINPKGLQTDTTSTLPAGKSFTMRLKSATDRRIVLTVANPRVAFTFTNSTLLQQVLGFETAQMPPGTKEKRAERFILGLNGGKKLTEEFVAARPMDSGVAIILNPAWVGRSCGKPGVQLPAQPSTNRLWCRQVSSRDRICLCASDQCNGVVTVNQIDLVEADQFPPDPGFRGGPWHGGSDGTVAPAMTADADTDDGGGPWPDDAGGNDTVKRTPRNQGGASCGRPGIMETSGRTVVGLLVCSVMRASNLRTKLFRLSVIL